MAKASLKTEIFTRNSVIIKDGANAIYFKNQGDGNVVILDNRVLEPDEAYKWETYTAEDIIDVDIQVNFPDPNADNQLLVERVYFDI